jgi:hypothetical protein
VLRSKHLERLVCFLSPSGTTLDGLGTMDRAQLSAIVERSKEAQVQVLVDLAAQMAVCTAQHSAGGGKFSGELRGGPLAYFYQSADKALLDAAVFQRNVQVLGRAHKCPVGEAPAVAGFPLYIFREGLGSPIENPARLA